jgi:hypothetical protein
VLMDRITNAVGTINVFAEVEEEMDEWDWLKNALYECYKHSYSAFFISIYISYSYTDTLIPIYLIRKSKSENKKN